MSEERQHAPRLTRAQGQAVERELAWERALAQDDLNRICGTEGVVYDLDLFVELGAEEFLAYLALEQLAQEFPDEIDMDRARREPSVYLRVLDRVTAKRYADHEARHA